MASKRVSLKGKGAALFFGDYTPPGGQGVAADTLAVAASSAEPERSEPSIPGADTASAPAPLAARATRRTAKRSPGSASAPEGDERTNERTNDIDDGAGSRPERGNSDDQLRDLDDNRAASRSFERTDERSFERPRVRHSFDVFEDQLHALAEIQIRRFTATRRKPKLGELVQEALDAYIAQNDRPNVRSNGR